MSSASAETITYEFSGTIDMVDDFLSDLFQVGDPITGFFTYEADAVDLSRGPEVGSYIGSLLSFELNVAGYTAASGSVPGDIVAHDDRRSSSPIPHWDSYTAVAIVRGDTLGDGSISAMLAALQMLDSDGDALQNTGLTPPRLDNFSDPLVTIDFLGGGSGMLSRITGRLTELELVPEPIHATLWWLVPWLVARQISNRG